MKLFQRAIRLFLLVATVVGAAIMGIALFFYRQIVRPVRQPIWANPEDAGMPYEEVEFPARDGLRLSGWYIPTRGNSKGTVIVVHGWCWNRLGEGADHLFGNLLGAQPVDLLRVVHALHMAGYAVFSYDSRSHGNSAYGGPMTFGLREADDVLGAVDYLLTRNDVHPQTIGVVGFSAGANGLLYSLPRTGRIKAAVAVQPTSARVFSSRLAHNILGPLGRPVSRLVELFYMRATGGLRFSAIEPVFAAAGAGDTPVLYIQGEGDRWGSVSNVAHMAAVTPQASGPVLVPGEDRYDGYRYAVSHPELIVDFLDKHLAG